MCGTGGLSYKMLSQREKLTLSELYSNLGMQPSEIDLDIIDIDTYLEDHLCINKWQILILNCFWFGKNVLSLSNLF